jgi:hypothetical protein
VLLDRSWADAEFRRDFFIAAALNQQMKNLLVAACDFNLIQVQHFSASSSCSNANACNRSTSFAKVSPSKHLPNATQMQHLRIPTAA